MSRIVCDACGSVGFQHSDDGFMYCTTCGTQSKQYREEELDDMALTTGYNVTRAGQGNLSRFAQEEALKKLQQRLQGGTIEDEIEAELDPEAARAREDELQRMFSQVPGDDENDLVRATLASQYSRLENVHVWAGADQMYDHSELSSRLSEQLRSYYLEGVQTMLQMQLEFLVRDLGMSPLICGIAGSIWLRFVASTHVLDEDWPQEAILVADAKVDREKAAATTEPPVADAKEETRDESKSWRRSNKRPKKKRRKKNDQIPRTQGRLRVSRVWAESLKDRIPLRVTLSIVYLACHIAREPYLPTDITKWATEGRLPYLTAFLKIEAKKFIGPDMRVIHIPEMELKTMFRPVHMTNGRMVEMGAAYIAQRLGLELPPVNFHALSNRLISELGLLENTGIASHLERLYEWYVPEGLWISGRFKGFPSRTYVMAMLIVALKLLYKIDGHSESSLYWPSVKKALRTPRSAVPDRFQSLLDSIEKTLLDGFIKSDDNLLDYLNYCRDIVYPSLELSADQSLICDHLWQKFEKFMKEQENETENDDEEEDEEGEAPLRQRQQNSESSASSDDDDDDYTSGSAAWSKTPTANVTVGNDENALGSISAEQQQQQQQQEEQQQEEDSTAAASGAPRKENAKVHQGRLRLLKTISSEMKRCGFKLVPATSRSSSSSSNHSEEDGSYLVYTVRKTSPMHKKQVHGDYFIVLFACARLVGIKLNVLHRCVQLVEEDLLKMERSIGEFVESSGVELRP